MIDMGVFYKGAIILIVVELIFWVVFGTSMWLILKKKCLNGKDE